MLRFPTRPLHAPVRLLHAAAVAALSLAIVAGCFPDGPVEVDTSTVTVQVRGPDNAPVAGAQVAWWPVDLTEAQAEIVGTTGSTGNVTFEVLSLWEDIRIRISAPAGFAVPGTQPNPVDAALLPGVTTVTFHLVAQT
jgi:hypothetical protein